MKSVLQDKKECFVCKTTCNLHDHHIFFSANRPISEKYGYKVWLCANHHNMSDEGVHFNRTLDLKLKRLAQMHWITHGRKTEEFIKEFGKSWL